MSRVHAVLAGLGFTEPTRLDAISAFQNAGILFRERGPLPVVAEPAPGTAVSEVPHRA
jgi:hypothetical protein